MSFRAGFLDAISSPSQTACCLLTASMIWGPAAFAQSKSKTKTPIDVSVEAAQEEPDEQGMEKEDDASAPKIQDKTGSASGLGLDKNPLGAGGAEEEAPFNPSGELDEAAEDILDRSFSQPGVDQDTGHSRKGRSGEAKVAVPEQERALPGVKLAPKSDRKNAAASGDTEQRVVIKDKNVIKKIQNALIRRGAKGITADGVMGKSTINALKDFQEEQGLTANGNPDPSTLTKLGIIYIPKQ